MSSPFVWVDNIGRYLGTPYCNIDWTLNDGRKIRFKLFNWESAMRCGKIQQVARTEQNEYITCNTGDISSGLFWEIESKRGTKTISKLWTHEMK